MQHVVEECEMSSSCVWAPRKAPKMSLADLPSRVLARVMRSLEDEDLLALCSIDLCFITQINAMQKSSWKLSRCYRVSEERLVSALTRRLERSVGVDLSHCYWLSEGALLALVTSPLLLHLDLTGCCLPSPSLPEAVLRMRLHTLSFTWASHWRPRPPGAPSICYGGLRRLRVSLAHPSALYLSLKQVLTEVLPLCVTLHELCLDEFPVSGCSTGSNDGAVYFRQRKPVLPELRRLSLDLNSPSFISCLLHHLLHLRTRPLDDLYVGQSAFRLFRDSGLAKYFSEGKVNFDTLTSANLSDDPEQTAAGEELHRKWKWVVPNCRKFVMRHIKGPDLRGVARLIVDKCNGRGLKEVDFKGCRMHLPQQGIDMREGVLECVRVLSRTCSALTSLDLSLYDCVLSSQDNEQLIDHLRHLTELRSLRLPSTALTYAHHEMLSAPWRSKTVTSNVEDFKCSTMWKVSEQCVHLQILHVTYNECIIGRVVPDCTLSCISNWFSLKELYLVHVPCNPTGSFLSHVVRKCRQLEVLFLKNLYEHKPHHNPKGLWTKDQMRTHATLFETAPLQHLKRLRDLTIHQPCSISSRLVDNLSSCKSLERLRLENFHVEETVLKQFPPMFEKLERLIYVRMSGSSPVSMSSHLSSTLNWLKSMRTQLTFHLLNRGDPYAHLGPLAFGPHNPIVHAHFYLHKQ